MGVQGISLAAGTTGGAWGSQALGTVGGMFAGDIVAGGQKDYLRGMRQIADRQLEIDSQLIQSRKEMTLERMHGERKISEMMLEHNVYMATQQENLFKERAVQIMESAAYQETQLRKRGRQFAGTQRAAIAAAGILGETGTALEVMEQTSQAINEEASILKWNAMLAKWGVDFTISDIGTFKKRVEVEQTRLDLGFGIEARLVALEAESELGRRQIETEMDKIRLRAQEASLDLERTSNLFRSIAHLGMTFNEVFSPFSKQRARGEIYDTAVIGPTVPGKKGAVRENPLWMNPFYGMVQMGGASTSKAYY